jgi:hypothetical protein
MIDSSSTSSRTRDTPLELYRDPTDPEPIELAVVIDACARWWLRGCWCCWICCRFDEFDIPSFLDDVTG